MKKLTSFLLILLALALTFALQLGFIFLLLAMLPALVAYYIESETGKPSFKIVCATNFTATLPFIVPMIMGKSAHHEDIANTVQEPNTWLFIYLGAAAGWGLIYLCRYIARFLVTMSYDYHIMALQNDQKKLVEEWGDEITRPVMPATPGKK